MSANLPSTLNLASNKPMSANGKPGIFRYRSDNSSYSAPTSGTGDVIRLEIPCGRQGQYLFPKDSFIEGKLQVTSTDSALSQTIYIDQSVFSLFNRIRVFHGSNLIEDCLYVNRVWTSVYDLQVNEVERRGDAITKLVNDTTSSGSLYPIFQDGCNGMLVHTTSGTTNTLTSSSLLDFCFVLPSAVLGSLSTKALPIGLMGASSLYLELELCGATQALVTNSTTATLTYAVQDIYYNSKVVTLPSDVNDAVIQSTGGFINLPAVGYKAELKSIASGVTSFNDKFSFQFSSMKNFNFFLINTATAVGANTKRSITARTKAYASEYFLTINGEAYPAQTIQNPSRMYAELQRAWGGLTDTNFGGILTYQNYGSLAANNNTTADDVINSTLTNTKQKRFLAGIDLDRFSQEGQTLMAGTSSIGQMVNLQLNFSQGTSEALNLYAYVSYDILYHIEGGLITAKF